MNLVTSYSGILCSHDKEQDHSPFSLLSESAKYIVVYCFFCVCLHSHNSRRVNKGLIKVLLCVC